MTPRPYQLDALRSAVEGYAAGFRKLLWFIATGGGKTFCFLLEAQRRLQLGQSVLILAHRDDLVQQPFARAVAMGLSPAIEKAESTATPDDRLVIASLQSLWNSPKRIRRKFDLVIYDECHHSCSPKAREFLNSIDSPDTDFLGVTATPHRHDQQSLGEWWGHVAYEITLPQLIALGYLAPISVQCLPVAISLPKFAKEIPAEQADALLQPVLEEVARQVIAATEDRRHIIIFLPLIKSSQRFAALLTSLGLPAAHVDGEMRDRKSIEARFRAGEFRALCNSMVLTEGWDEPCVDCVVPLRPVKSSSLYQQMVGRGSRLHTGKPDCLLLDLLWQTKQHLARPASLFSADPELSFLASQIATKQRCNLADLAADTANALRIAREAALARKMAKEATRKAYRISYADLCKQVNLAPAAVDPGASTPLASEKQIRLLKNFKCELPPVLSKADASMLIGRLMAKRRNFARR